MITADVQPGIFKNKYPDLKGKDWIRRIDKEDLKVFIDIGLQAMDHGKLGGKARAKAKRDEKGRFVK